MMLRMQIIALILVGSLLLGTLPARAEEGDAKPKSMGAAVLLGLDPIPGDALFYADKPIQGTVNAVVGGIGGVIFWSCLAWGLAASKEDNQADGPIGAAAAGILLGAILYGPAILWDLFGGIHGVYKYNEAIERKKTSFLRAFQPTLAVTSNGALVGAQFRF